MIKDLFKRSFVAVRVVVAATVVTSLAVSSIARADTPQSLRERLKAESLKIAWEAYVDGNSDIFVMNADGSGKVNLTNTPGVNEHYPQISPDGTKICYTVDAGEGRAAVRSLWIMDVDGKNAHKIADQAREPFWRPDGKVIGYLPQEYPKFDVIDYYTKGMMFYHLDTGKSEPHPNSGKLRHLYHPRFTPNGKWIVSTVHGGMGFSHAILAIEANGNKIINLKIPGCRPTVSPDGKHIAWGSSDHDLNTALLDTDSDEPRVGKWQMNIKDSKNKIYHIAWSPDGRFVAFSRGPDGEGDLSKTGTFQAACEIIGVYAKDWNIWAVSVEHPGVVDLDKATDADMVQLTTDGASNKEPAWFSTKARTKE
jgi:Tol biopolymer transport system component